MAGTLELTVTSPTQSFDEPLGVVDVVEFLKLPVFSPTDTERDDELELFIPAAREIAEILQRRDLVEKQYDLSHDYFPEVIELRDKVSSVDLVQYRDSEGNYHTLDEDTDYIVDKAKRPAIIVPAYGKWWPSFTPWPSSAVLVRFTCGPSLDDVFWSDAGKRVKLGMLQLISHWYNGRLPFELGSKDGMNEYPFTVTANLSWGAVPSAK